MNNLKVDYYTKGVLTVIAVCLMLLTLQQFDLFPKAHAGEGNNNPILSNLNYGLVPLNEDGSITVKLDSYDELDVNIVGINTYDELEVNIAGINTGDELYVKTSGELDVNIAGINTYDELPVNIDEVGGSGVPPGGPISVEIE